MFIIIHTQTILFHPVPAQIYVIHIIYAQLKLDMKYNHE